MGSTRSRKRRKTITYAMMGILIFYAIILGAVISILTVPVDIFPNLIREDGVKNAGSIQEKVEHSQDIPIVDSSNIKITGTYPWPLNGIVAF